jgi:hypothetical protein
MYKTGGLEPSTDSSKTLDIDGVTYVVSDRFKSMLRDSFIDWGTFLEIYHDNLSYTLMFDQMIKLLNIKENDNLREFMIPLIKKIYHLPAAAHMACMVKQFMVYEPLSVIIHGLFTTIKLHYEYVFDKFLNARNNYIAANNLKDPTNDIPELKKYWENMDQQYNLDSSSVMLLFLHPPNGLKSRLNFNITGHEAVIAPLKDAVKKFHYLGFCPKVPQERLKALLNFPINEFIKAIRAIDPTSKFPDYDHIEKFIVGELEKMPDAPVIPDDYTRKEEPKNISDNLDLAKWYIEEILNLRKTLVKYGTEYETYYTEQARIFININDVLKKEFLHKH